jgi:tetratricopeptide (TPR) repeat protein
MNRKKTCNIRSVKAVLTVAFVLLAVSQSFAINGIVVKSANKERMKGDIRWQQSKKQYLVTANGITMTFKPSQVDKVLVPKPAGFDKALNDVKTKRYSVALPVLEKIMNDYKMMGWDVKATRYAAEAQLGLKNPSKAIMLCEKLIAVNPKAAYEGDLAEIYWQALVEGDRKATLRKIMAKAIKEGPRDLVPLVQIRRADIDMKDGKYKKALVDGYLRTVYFFKENKKYMPEALYKAAQCFDQLNEPANAEKMRKMLLVDYQNSEYGKKVTMGK